MDFSEALKVLMDGRKVAREVWREGFVVMMPSLELAPYNTRHDESIQLPRVNLRTAKYIGMDKPLITKPYLAHCAEQGYWQPGWLPSQSDLFADDWYEVR